MATKTASNGRGTSTIRQIKMVDVDKLDFDRENPRLPTTLKGKKEADIIKWMLRETGIIELMGSIGQKGYFPGEPLLVVPSTKGHFNVIEGNRRLCAVKLLSAPSDAPIRKQSIAAASKGAQKPGELPVVVYDNRDEILGYLGYRHITGIKQWDPLAKARYLNQLRKATGKPKNGEQFAALAKGIGSSANYAAKLLTGLALYDRISKKDFFDIEGLSEESISFSLLTTALSFKNIVGYLGLSKLDPTLSGLKEKNLRKLTQWLFKEENGVTRLVESRNLKALNAIVKSPRALEAFESGYPILEAEVLAGVPVEVFRKAVLGARKQLQNANETLPKVGSVLPSDSRTLEEVANLAGNMKTVIDKKIASGEAR